MKNIILLFLFAPLFSFSQITLDAGANYGAYWSGETFDFATSMASFELDVHYSTVFAFAGINNFAGYAGVGVIGHLNPKEKIEYDVRFMIYTNGVYISLPRDWGAEFGFSLNKKISPYIRGGFSTQLVYVKVGFSYKFLAIQ